VSLTLCIKAFRAKKGVREGDGTTSSIIKHTGFVKKLYILAIAWKNRQATGFAV
jgi:hypothetical protein